MRHDETTAYRELGKMVSENAQDRDVFKASVLGLFENLCAHQEYGGPESAPVRLSRSCLKGRT
jgi:hypothetical protein